MAYRHQYSNVILTASAVTLGTSGVSVGVRYFPGYMSEHVRGFYAVMTTTLPNCSGAVAVLQRISYDVATTATTIATINFTATANIGVVFYEDDIQYEIGPGDQVQVDITDIATVAGTAIFGMYVTPKFETPQNATNCRATT